MPPSLSAAQDPQAIEEVAEILVDASGAVRRREKEIVQARDGEAQRRVSKLVGKRVPLGERERPQRFVSGSVAESIERIAAVDEAQRVHARWRCRR